MASTEEYFTKRSYVSLSVLLSEIGGLSSIYLAIFAIMNVTLNEWSQRYELFNCVISESEKKKHGIKKGICTLIGYYTFGVFCCCSKKVREERRKVLDFYEGCRDQIDYYLDGKSLITI